MNRDIVITVPGEPRPWGVEAFTLKTAQPYTVGARAALRDKPASKTFKRRVALAARDAYHGPLLTGALRVDIDFFLRRPKTVTRGFHTVKPDLTNLRKSCEDGLTGVVYKDDAQIIRGETTKNYTITGEQMTIIRIGKIAE